MIGHMPVPFPKDYPYPKPSPLAAPFTCSPELIAKLTQHLRETGLSERQAALACGIYPDTLLRWKREHPYLIPLLASASPPTPPSPAPPPNPPATPRPPGRPSRYSPALADSLCQLVRLHGLTDSRAGLHHGLPRNTIGYWKRVHPDFAVRLRQARAEFHQNRLASLPPLPEPPANAGWRYHARLLRRAFPSEYGGLRLYQRARKPSNPSHKSENPAP